MTDHQPYVGRFAPSPTGPLHFGSLVAAVASYLDALSNHGTWLLRVEDLDPPRESPDAPGEIYRQLETYGFEFSRQQTLHQSDRLGAYEAALEILKEKQLIYPCTCARKSFAQIYPGKCRHVHSTDLPTKPFAYRFKLPDGVCEWEDIFAGHQSFDFETEVGDFVIKRKDGLFAYQLAVVVDDIFQSVTHIVRGNDLLDSTPRQIALFKALDRKPPEFGHIPIIVDQEGQKLSKQAHASPIPLDNPSPYLAAALAAVGIVEIELDQPARMLKNAAEYWQRSRVPKQDHITLDSLKLP